MLFCNDVGPHNNVLQNNVCSVKHNCAGSPSSESDRQVNKINDDLYPSCYITKQASPFAIPEYPPFTICRFCYCIPAGLKKLTYFMLLL